MTVRDAPSTRAPDARWTAAGPRDDRDVEDVAGYRVLRVVGHGARSRVLLGFADGRTVALKVCAAADPRVAAELEALDRAAGEHVVALDDVAADEHSTVLVLERLAPVTLADLLERRSRLAAGEAVTILAPLATTLDRLHGAGVAHGGLTLASVGFRENGAPTLLGFGGAEVFAPGAPEVVRETVPGVLADRDAFRELASLVLGRVAGPRAEAARRLAAGMTSAPPGELAAALFALATPAPVQLEEDPDGGASRVGEPRERDGKPEDPGGVVLPPWVLAFVPDWLRGRLSEVVERAVAAWGSWSSGRRRLVLAGGAGALTVAVALAVLPASPSTVPADPVLETSAPEAEADDLPDDPVEAVAMLLARRDDCLRDLSALCLDGVVQPGSAAQADDVALVRGVLAGSEYPEGGILPGAAVLVERLGDSALLDLPEGSAPSSLLLMRTDEGWRIRQYLRDPDLDAPAFDAGTG